MSNALKHVGIFGAGKLGSGLFRALRKAGIACSLRPMRKGLPTRAWACDLLVLALRETDLPHVASAIAEKKLVTKRTAVVHVSGALGSDVLAPLRGVALGVAQMHPMIAFASMRVSPHLNGGHMLVEGDVAAVRRARRLALVVGMRPRMITDLDRVGYHAAAGLVANGAAALAAAGTLLLERSGVRQELVPFLLGPLLRSVAENVETLGLPDALTGPVRRGDASGVRRHLDTLETLAPELRPLYCAMALAQLPLARSLGDAPLEAFDRVERVLCG